MLGIRNMMNRVGSRVPGSIAPPQPQQPLQSMMQQPQGNPELRGLLQQKFEEPKKNWADKLGLLSGMLMDYDGTFGQGNADAAQARWDQRVEKERGLFDQNRNEQLMMAAASGDPFALAMLDPIGNRAFEYGKSRDQIGDQRWQMGWDEDQRRYGDTRGDRREDVDFRNRGHDFNVMNADRGFDLQAELGRGNLSLGWANHGLQKDQAENGKENYGLNIVWGMDDQGNYVPMQAGKSGGLTASQVPEGVTPLGPYGTAFDTAQGKEEAKRAALKGPAGQALTTFEVKAGEITELIDKAIEQADFWNTGATSFGVWSPDFNATLDSIGSRAFLSELISVKSQGGTFGALSDAEGRALRDAALNIKKSQSQKQLTENLQRYKAQLQSSVANLQRAFEDDYVNNRPARRPPGTGNTAPAQPGNLSDASDDDLFNILGGR